MLDYLSSLLSALPVILPLGLAFYYLGLPLIVRASQRMEARPAMKPLDFRRVNPAVAEFLTEQAELLLGLGFDEPTHLRIPNAVPNVTSYLILLVNRETSDEVMVTVIIADAVPPLQTWYVEFSTRYDSGVEFNTLNSAELLPWPPAPTCVRTQVPSVREVEELYDLHRHVVAKHAPEGRAVAHEPGTVIEYLTETAFRKPYDRQVGRGWLYYDKAESAYFMTVCGAYGIVWGLQQPFKWLRGLAMRREERRILGEFERAQG